MIPLSRIRRRLGRPLHQFHPVVRWLVATYRFMVHVVRLWDQRDCFRMASSLAFESLFSLVPLAALSLWFIDALGQSEHVSALANYVGRQLFPSFGVEAIQMIRKLASRIRGEYLGTVGAVFTLVISVWVFVSVESALNALWGTREKRPFFHQFSTYWTLASLLPLMAILVFLRRTDFPVLSSIWLGHLLLIFFFFLINKLVPTPFVKASGALVGALVSFALFQIARELVSRYFTSKYFGIYGEIGVLFLVLMWIYYIWLILLLGSAISYVVQRFSYLEARRITESRWAVFPGEPIAWRAWSVLDFMYHNRELHDAQSLALALGETPAMIERICARLAEEGLLFAVDGQYGLVIEDARKITVSRVARAFAQPIHGEVGGSTVIWQELSDAFMQVGESVNLVTSPEEFADVRDLFETSQRKGTGPLPTLRTPSEGVPRLVPPVRNGETAEETAEKTEEKPEKKTEEETAEKVEEVEEKATADKATAEKTATTAGRALDLGPLFDPGRGKPRG